MTKNAVFRGLHGTVDSDLASHPAGPGFDSWRPKFFFYEIRCCQDLSTAHCLEREWTVQSLIVDQTHQVLVSGARTTKKKEC